MVALLNAPIGQQLAAGDAGRRGYKARHLLADVYRCQDRRAEAEAQWRLVVEAQPRFAPAWHSLAELYLAQGRWADLEEVLGALADVSESAAAAVRASAIVARNEQTSARMLPERGASIGLAGGELLERSAAMDTATPLMMNLPVPRAPHLRRQSALKGRHRIPSQPPSRKANDRFLKRAKT